MKKVLLLLMIAGLVGSASATTNWERATVDGPGNWNDAANWSAFVPAGTDTGEVDPITGDPILTTVDFGGPPSSTMDAVKTATNADWLSEIQVTDAQNFGRRIRVGYNEDPATANSVLRITSTGSLMYGDDPSRTYIGDTSDGQMIIEAGGSFTHGHRVTAGNTAGVTGILDIAGTLTLSNNLNVGKDGTGLVNISGDGVVNLLAPGDLKFGGVNSVLDITGNGSIVFPGSVTGTAGGLLPSIHGNGILGNVEVSYDSIDDVTMITAIPEPATMILLGLGGLLIRKRR